MHSTLSPFAGSIIPVASSFPRLSWRDGRQTDMCVSSHSSVQGASLDAAAHATPTRATVQLIQREEERQLEYAARLEQLSANPSSGRTDGYGRRVSRSRLSLRRAMSGSLSAKRRQSPDTGAKGAAVEDHWLHRLFGAFLGDGAHERADGALSAHSPPPSSLASMSATMSPSASASPPPACQEVPSESTLRTFRVARHATALPRPTECSKGTGNASVLWETRAKPRTGTAALAQQSATASSQEF